VQSVVADSGLSDSLRYYIADIRDSKDFAAGHIPNSVNIGIRGRFETWVGIMVPWNSQLVLTGEETDLAEAVHRLHRVGYQARVLPMTQWHSANLPVLKNTLIAPKTLYEQMQSGQSPIILDVRLPNEWMGLRIGTVLNLPLNHLAELSAKLDPAQPVVAVCNSAYRSSMAIGILERKNFKNVTSLEGGSEAWIEASLPVFSSQTQGHTQAPSQRMIPLPERVCQAELKRMMMDLPGTFEIVDIRPPQMFSDYSLPGSRNVDMAELTSNPAYLIGTGPLIIVDRDGTLAMAVGGILAQKTQRQIKVLFGGLEAYWQESTFGPPASVPSMGSIPKIAPGQAPAPPSIPSTGTPVVRKKSAGC
jgi:rhodanese-related sulfurtransferase